MRSFYGDECAKHPEIAGRRYLPNRACIKCHSAQNKERHVIKQAKLKELFEAASMLRRVSPRLDAALQALGK
jgi:hypothetical protein